MWFLFLLLSIAKWIAIASCACSTLAILGVVLMMIRGALKRLAAREEGEKGLAKDPNTLIIATVSYSTNQNQED